MNNIQLIDLETALRQTRYERGITLDQIAEVMKEVYDRDELDTLIGLLKEKESANQ